MKTVVPKSLLLGIFCWLATGIALGQTTYFSQDFAGGGTINDYNTGSTHKFTGIGLSTGATGITVSIVNNALEFERTAGTNGGYFSKIDGFSGTPSTMILQFSMNLFSNSKSQAGAATFFLGTGFANNATNIYSSSEVFAKLTIDFNSTSGQFRFRDIASNTTTAYFSGNQSITWILKSSGYNTTYNIPSVGTGSLTYGKWDLWVGSTKVFSGLDAINPALPMAEFKFTFNGAASPALAKLSLDNFLIRDIEGFLPVSLTKFNAQVNEEQDVEVEWMTASERNSKSFTIERSSDLKTYTTIAQLDAAGNSNNLTTYRFKDENPLLGTSYYRLLQTDLDGSTVPYRPVAVTIETDFSIFPNPVATTSPTWTIRHPQATDLTVRLLNALGLELPAKVQSLPAQEWLVTPNQALSAGMYILQVESSNKIQTKKVWIY
ncbi:MAG: T9SS type A sorting domain-containing protein [Spirosomataceae bacterium]